jgi:hypothetical protein
LQALRPLAGDIDPAFGHDGDRQGIDGARYSSGAVALEAVSGKGAQKALGHLAARAVGTGEKENLLDHVCLRWMNPVRSILLVPDQMRRRAGKRKPAATSGALASQPC